MATKMGTACVMGGTAPRKNAWEMLPHSAACSRLTNEAVRFGGSGGIASAGLQGSYKLDVNDRAHRSLDCKHRRRHSGRMACMHRGRHSVWQHDGCKAQRDSRNTLSMGRGADVL